MFRASNKGFNVTFDNGWTASVQWGPGNYCDNRFNVSDDGSCESRSAEIAAWDVNGKWLKFETDTVKGWVKPNDVLKFLNMVSRKKPAKPNGGEDGESAA